MRKLFISIICMAVACAAASTAYIADARSASTKSNLRMNEVEAL